MALIAPMFHRFTALLETGEAGDGDGALPPGSAPVESSGRPAPAAAASPSVAIAARTRDRGGAR